MNAPLRGWGTANTAEPRRGEVTGARRLLRRLVQVVAQPITPQDRLDQIVGMIAAELVAEVCSVYVLRPGEVLELFATEGLEKSAVHRTRLRVGEGLVGTIAAQGQLINAADAQNHPAFVFHPETGEEIYRSMLGVPILRGGMVVGVLTIQNKVRRVYREDEVEAMQVIASVLGEMVVSGGIIDLETYGDVRNIVPEPSRLSGLRLVEGVGIGPAWLHEPRVPILKLIADDPEKERGRLDLAVDALHKTLDAMLDHHELRDGEQREVLEAFRMFAGDSGWLRHIREAVSTGLTAEAAVRRVREETRVRIGHTSDPYLRERLFDLDDLADRLMRHLAGKPLVQEHGRLPQNTVLVARMLSAADLLEYGRDRLAGVVLEEGSRTAHVTIVARAMDIPVIGRVPQAMTTIDTGDIVALDGTHGQVYVRPNPEVMDAFGRSVQAHIASRKMFEAMRDLPSVSADGIPVGLHVNGAFLIDIDEIERRGAEGCGLFRTELAFMTGQVHPDTATQAAHYNEAINRAAGQRLQFRTLDIGSDKKVPYWRIPAEDNPAMGWRAIRMALDLPAMLRIQLRAMLRAAAGRPLSIMFPMVAHIAELDQAIAILELEKKRAAKRGEPLPETLEIGVMFEVPALYWQMPQLLKRIDFLAVGTNDLTQFMFAVDRGNPTVSDRFDVLAPALLTLVLDIVDRCRMAGVRLSVCGEMAAQPLEAMALVGCGVRQLSMPPSDVGPIKALIRSLELAPLRNYVRQLAQRPEASVRDWLRAYAVDHGAVLPKAELEIL
ncbi:MAG: phosphoenolpyruvate--protein phosphotransferase [Pseudomonadota bacterium]